VSVYDAALRRRETVAEGTAAFYFDKAAGFVYQAGQKSFSATDHASEACNARACGND